ncbi:HTH domain-containing protein [Chitinophaga sp.]|uniref:HTH domain-containing protein n=1 Tax=Chitinophaga sp. TaxID=1869181 RepID=UPI002CC65130|nr:DeoR family transcriptional regulator [Chitinophaga sp.]HWV67951.1 DeoR family transcriptional regulator [Chitinophaga sp.]
MFTPAAICQVHTIITNNTLTQTDEEGTFRKDNEIRVVDVQTGDTIYTPPAYDQLETLMEHFCTLANDLDKQTFFLHPILKGIFLHFLIMTLLRNTTFNDRQISILQEIIQNPDAYFSVKQIQNKFAISNQTARNDLDRLTNNGLLEYRKSGKKNQFFPVKDFYNKIKKGL